MLISKSRQCKGEVQMTLEKSLKLLDIYEAHSTEGNLVDLWLATQYDAHDFDVSDRLPFEERRELFLWSLGQFLANGKLRLMKNGAYLNGTPEEQVALFRQGFPASEIPDPRYPNEDASFWFYWEECPGEAVWRVKKPDGTVEWLHCP